MVFTGWKKLVVDAYHGGIVVELHLPLRHGRSSPAGINHLSHL